MHSIKSKDEYQPAPGLLRLTWPQVQAIDAKVSSLCALTEQSGTEARVVIVIKKGQARFVEMHLSDVLNPQRN